MACRVALLAGAVGTGIASDRPAQACGGCFSPPTEVTVVTDHRMAFSVSQTQSVLWDQIEYSGNPKDFSWVLPVRSGTVVQLSSEEWFSALDSMTSPTIVGPYRPCNSPSGGCSSTSAGGAAASDEGSGGGVQVIAQNVVGPYDTATLRATDPNALENWLTAHGYVLPSAIRPTINAYVAGGFDFIALRLQPGQGVQAMQPVRVVTQGADLTLPLRMVAAGVGAQVGVTLYVVGEGRYEAAAPFSNATIDDSKLFWFHTQNRSNYQELSQSIMQQNGGRTWLTEYAQPLQMSPGDPVNCVQVSSSYSPNYGYDYGSELGATYLSTCCKVIGATYPSGAGDDASAAAPGEAGDIDAPTSEAGDIEAAASEDAGQGSPGATDSGAAQCAGDDLEVAITGLHQSIWVTRLRAVLPASALSEHDLLLQASSSQSPVSSRHNTANYDDPSYSPCGNAGGGGCAASGSDPHGMTPWLEGSALAMLAMSGWRRKRFSARSSRR